MLNDLRLDSLLVFDIETVPAVAEYGKLPERMRQLWEDKKGRFRPEEETPDEFYFNHAGILSEFGKIICISAGFFRLDGGSAIREFRLKSFFGDEEKTVLEGFTRLLEQHYNQPGTQKLAGHNIREFDVPYVARRLMVHGMPLPAMLDIQGKKPWEVDERFVDTMQLWKFGDYKHFTSLDLLSAIFGLPSPKADISGKDVARVYWQEGRLDDIRKYCQRDVVAVARLLLKFMRKPDLPDDCIVETV